MESPWDGRSRAPLRWGLGVMLGWGVLKAVKLLVLRDETGDPHGNGDALPIALTLPVPVTLVLGAAAIAALVMFVRRPARAAWGLAALLVTAVLQHALTVELGEPRRNYYHAGAMLTGWLFGLFCAGRLRQSAGEPHGGDPARLAWDERCGELGALGAWSATYFSAGAEKLLRHGLDWADDSTLHAIVLAHNPVDAHGLYAAYTHFVLGIPFASRLLGIATLLFECAAVLALFGPRLRMLSGLAIALFHMQVSAMTDISYDHALMLGLLFTQPWPKLSRKPKVPESPPTAPNLRSALAPVVGWLAGIAVVLWVVALLRALL